MVVMVLLLQVESVRAQLNANFKANITHGCAPVTVQFTDLSKGSPLNWSWDFGNGNTSTIKNPGAIYQNPGIYTVKLTVRNATNTDSLIKISYIQVFANPKAEFNFTPQNTCPDQLIYFKDNSTLSGGAPIKSWDWVFGDGTITDTIAPNTAHLYVIAGSFPVTLIITDTNQCTSNTTQTVIVNPAPIAAFSVSPITTCHSPETSVFSNNSKVTGSASYKWYFGDGTTSSLTSPSHSFNTNGSYNVSLVVTNGNCKDSITQTNAIQLLPLVANFVVDTSEICLGQTIQFTNQTVPNPTTSTWYFGDGTTSLQTNVVHTYPRPGTYSVALKVNNGKVCSDSIMKNLLIQVDSLPTANFSYKILTTCALPIPVSFQNTSTGALNWTWNFGDGTPNVSGIQHPTHNYTTQGPFRVTLSITNKNGCTDSIQQLLPYIAINSVNFTAPATSGCAPLQVKFNADSTKVGWGDSITTYKWYLGNDTILTSVDTLTTSYIQPIKATVKLIIQTKNGCLDSLVKVNYIQAGTPPNPNFYVVDSVLCYGSPAVFENYSNGSTTWLWKFGDKTTDSTKAPNHIYGDTGTFTVTLIAADNGCIDSLVKPNYVTIHPPVPAFVYKMNCDTAFQVTFTSQSIGADSLVWNFGDGQIDSTNTKSPTHTYTGRGIENVVLTAYNQSFGCSSTSNSNIQITQPKAVFSANPMSGCYPMNTTFSDLSQDDAKDQWYFGNSDSSNLKNPITSYDYKGRFTVELIITDVNGCTDTSKKINYIQTLGPTPYFTADTTKGCTPLTIAFTDTSISDSTIVTRFWDFGDGQTTATTNKQTTHQYMQSGYYTVSLAITDKNGCSKSIPKVNYIFATFPIPAFTADTLSCRNAPVNFNASATNAYNPTYVWNFGDTTNLQSITQATTTHTYHSYITYTPTLTVTDGNNCSASIQHTVVINQPVALFSDTVIGLTCGIENVQFKDLSSGYISKWQWNFGNGATSIVQNPAYTYTSPGTYNLSLIATSIIGCRDTIQVDSAISVPGPVGSFTFNPTKGCNPLHVDFIATSMNAQNYTWDFGDGTVLTSPLDSASHTYTKDIVATPILLMGKTLSNGSFCQLPATDLSGSITVFTTISLSIKPNTITLQDGSFTGITPVTNIKGPFVSQWSPTEGIDCPNCFDVTLTSLGATQTYTLTVIDTLSGGCIATDSVKVVETPCKDNFVIPNVFSPNGDGINDIFLVAQLCEGYGFEMKILDRWGELLFETTSPKVGWDGKTKAGIAAPVGVYYYAIRIDDKEYNGFLQLVTTK